MVTQKYRCQNCDQIFERLAVSYDKLPQHVKCPCCDSVSIIKYYKLPLPIALIRGMFNGYKRPAKKGCE